MWMGKERDAHQMTGRLYDHIRRIGGPPPDGFSDALQGSKAETRRSDS